VELAEDPQPADDQRRFSVEPDYWTSLSKLIFVSLLGFVAL
jgi:hypothetical protein